MRQIFFKPQWFIPYHSRIHTILSVLQILLNCIHQSISKNI